MHFQENLCMLIQISPKFVPSCQIMNKWSLYPPKRSLGGVYWIHPVRPSVCLSVRPSVRTQITLYEEDKNYPIWRRQERRSKYAVQLASWQLRSNSPKTSVGRCPDDNSNSFFYIYHLGQDLAWDWISASYLIKYAHTGRSCDLLIFGIPEVNFLVRAFQFGMKGVLSRIYDISPGFCWIPIFVFFLNFLRVS